jgi:hypothetical protein
MQGTHTLGRGAWEVAAEELEAAPGAKETWEAAAGTESPASICSFSFFFLGTWLLRSSMKMICICTFTFVKILIS